MNRGWLTLCGLLVATLAGGVAWSGDPAGPSRAVYPPASSSLRFRHQAHRQVKCVACHASALTSVSPADRLLPDEGVCRPCHKQTRRQTKAAHAGGPGCAHCHTGWSGRGAPPRTLTPTANLRFSHRLHQQRGVACASCHQMNTARRALPTMATCRACHQKKGASRRCVVCHLSNKDGRLVTRFSSGKLVPRGSLKGDTHGPLFRRKHGAVARNERRYCESCHQPRSCLKCHQGSLRPLSIHSGDYVRRHTLDARKDQPRCRSCHRSQTFCLSCHQRLGVGQETRGNGFRPTTSLRFHPKGFASYTKGPGHHAYAARRNMRACASCHRENTCVRCHGPRKQGQGGFSPHGPGFGSSTKCRMLAARNQRVCLKCHVGTDRRIACQ